MPGNIKTLRDPKEPLKDPPNKKPLGILRNPKSSKEILTNPQKNLRNPKKSQGNLSVPKDPYKTLRTLRSPKKPEDP